MLQLPKHHTEFKVAAAPALRLKLGQLLFAYTPMATRALLQPTCSLAASCGCTAGEERRNDRQPTATMGAGLKE